MSGPKKPIIRIMRYLLFILAFPILVQAQTKQQQCDRLNIVAKELEKKIQTKIIGEACDELPKSDIPNFDYRCKDLASIDMQLKSLENEIAMFSGVTKLRNETVDAKSVLDKAENKSLSVTASHAFYQNLKIAATIEGFLEAKGIKNESLMSELAKGEDKDFLDVQAFTDFVSKTCIRIGVNKGSRICDNPKNLTLDEMKEVNGLLLLGRKTKRKFEDGQTKELREAMAIKDGDKEYNFTKLLSEVSAPGENQAFSEKDMDKIASHKLSAKGKDFNFLSNMSVSTQTMQNNKEVRSAQGLPQRFQEYFTSLKSREEYELKAKLSVVLNELKDHIPDSVKVACSEARTLSGSAEDCLKALADNDKLGGAQRNSAQDILYELKFGQEQIKRLDRLMAACVPNTDMTLHSDCSQFFNPDIETLQKKTDALRAIKAKILEGSEQLLTARDLALHTIVMKECMSETTSQVVCEDEQVKISREAIALSDSTGEIVLLLDKPAAAPDFDAICKSTPQNSNHLEEICKYALTKESDPVPKKRDFSPNNSPIEAPQGRNVAGQAWADMLGGLGQTLGNFLAPRQQMINPYQSIFPSTNIMGQPRDIKNQIMDPYMATGFGGYAPTAGLRPYSSVNSNMGVSSAYTFGASSFFNSPVGW